MRHRISRRTAVKTMLGSSAALAAWGTRADEPAPATEPPPVTGQANPDLAPFDDMMVGFIKTHQVPGAALAVTKDSRLIYARGFGYADLDARQPVQPDSLFRIASISKPFTAVAVLQQVERGKFKLDDRVFDVLPAGDWLPEKYDERLRTITIRQLLQHTGGWDRNKTFDPIGRVPAIAEFLKKSPPVGPADVIRYTLTLPLDFDPGTRYAYYNVDYLLLGRLIEHATGQPYESVVKQTVLQPVGISQMQLGRVWKDDLAKNEVHYYDSKRREGVAVNGPRLGAKVPLVYGAENLEGYEAHGGWIASAVDLVRFASAFDRPEASKLLKAETIKTMWAVPEGPAGHDAAGKPSSLYYGCGWQVRVRDDARINTFHSGLITGTSTILVRRHDGLNWAVLFNTENDQHGKALSGLVDALVHQAADAVRRWPEQSLTI